MFAAKDRLPYNATASRQPGTFAAPACLLQTSDRSSPDCSCPQEPRRRRVSSLPTLLPAQNFQPSHFQSLPHSLQQEQKLTPAFPSASGLFLRYSPQERKLTPLFKNTPALFGETTGEGGRYFHQLFRVWALLGARAETSLGCTCSPRNKMDTYARRAANPCRMRTSKIIGLKASCNEHLQKRGEGVGVMCYPAPAATPTELAARHSHAAHFPPRCHPEAQRGICFSGRHTYSPRESGAGSTRSPRKSGVGSTWSPRK